MQLHFNQQTASGSVSKLLLKLSTLVVMATILLVSKHSNEIQRFSTILDQLWCRPYCYCCVHKLQVSTPLNLCERFEFADTFLGALLFYYLYKHTHHQNEDMDHKGHYLPNAAVAPKVFVRTRDSSLTLEYWCQWISHDALHPVDDDDTWILPVISKQYTKESCCRLQSIGEVCSIFSR